MTGLRAVEVEDRPFTMTPMTGVELARRAAEMIRVDLHRVPVDDPMRPSLIALMCAGGAS